MSAELVENFFPATTTLLRSHLPWLWVHFFPPEGQQACPAPSIIVTLPSGSNLKLKWPLLIPLCIIGIVIGAICGIHLLQRTLLEKRPLKAAYSWAHAFLWYGAMCFGGLVYHCVAPNPVYRMIDITSTSCSSTSIIAALLAHGDFWDDSCMKGRFSLFLVEGLIALLALVAHPLVKEQLYLFPTFLCGLVMVRILQGSTKEGPGDLKVFGSLKKHDLHGSQFWLALTMGCMLVGFSVVRFDRWLCSNLGPHFLVIIWVFLGSDLAFYFMYLFANTLISSQSYRGEDDGKRD